MSRTSIPLQRLTLGLAWVAAVLIALLAPASYFLLARQSVQKSLEAQTVLLVHNVNGIIQANPKMWRFEEVRLVEVLERKAHDGVPQVSKLFDSSGELIARSHWDIDRPTLSYSHVISDAGAAAGHVEVSRSLRPILYSTAVTAALSLILAVGLFFVFRSIPLRIIRKAFYDLEESEKKYRSLYETMKEGMALHRVELDEAGGISSMTVIDVNHSCVAMFGVDLDMIVGSESLDLFGGCLREFLPELLRVIGHGEPVSFEFCIPGREEYYNVQAFSPGPSLIATLFDDITERRKSEQQIERMAYQDALTGLPNRTLLYDRLNQAVALSKRQSIPLAVLFLDLDRFKQINDTLGHAAGDLLLIEVSRRLRSLVRTSDTLARLGGDEFVLVISNLNRQLDITIVAQNLMNAISEPFHIHGHDLRVTSSIGIAFCPEDGVTAEELVKHADMAMYSSKEQGRSSYNFYSPIMNQKALDRMETEIGLRGALERQEFFLAYQPIICCDTLEIVAAEALVRWNHPSGRLVPPGDFIPQAEENGLIIPLGEWVLRTVCRQMKAWNDAGYPRIRFCVNVSSKQIEKKEFPRLVKSILEETGADGAQLELEITESCLLSTTDDNIKAVFGMRQWGISIALDDFGTGYSSLGYIKTLPIDHIKLDRTFVAGLCTDSEDEAIVDAIISMSQRLGIRNIAEGVETEAQAAYVRKKGCDEIQGYYFHRPLSVTAFEKLLDEALLKPGEGPVEATCA